MSNVRPSSVIDFVSWVSFSSLKESLIDMLGLLESDDEEEVEKMLVMAPLIDVMLPGEFLPDDP